MEKRRSHLLLLVATLCFGAVVVALVSQHVFDMPPCAWCVLQRMIYVVIGGVALAAWLLPELWQRLAAVILVLLSICGAAVAWHQYAVAANSFSCSLTFADQVVSSSGLDALLPHVFGIFATCLDAKVELLGVEYALWSLATFVIVAFVSLAAVFGKRSAYPRVVQPSVQERAS